MTKTKSQLISIEELIKLFINDRKDGKKESITWLLNNLMNEEIRRRTKTVLSFPDGDSAMKLFYLKSVNFNSRHAFREMN